MGCILPNSALLLPNEETAKVTLLGTGTSTGVPVPGCGCDICQSSEARDKRLRCSALVSSSCGANILIDPSPDFRQQALRIGLKRLDAVLYTHAHSDHILGTDDLRCFCFKRESRLPCYGRKETLSVVKAMFGYAFADNPNYKGGMLPKLEAIEIESYRDFCVEGISISPLEVLHGDMKVSAFKIGDFAYVTDCKTLPNQAKESLKGVQNLVISALRFRTHPTHLSIPEATQTCQALSIANAWFTHITHDVGWSDPRLKELPSSIKLAYDGLEIEINPESSIC